MNIVRTTTCSSHLHGEFVIEYDSQVVLACDVEWFAKLLESWVRDGERFCDGESVQIGWSSTVLRQSQSGELHFSEPDFTSMPAVWQSGLTRTLAHLRLHKDVIESLLPSDTLAIPSLRQSCFICKKLDGAKDFMMARSQPDNRDSGWFVGCYEEHDHNDPNSLTPMSLYQAILQHAPGALPYLALPPESQVAIKSGKSSFFIAGKRVEPKIGSYLDRVGAEFRDR
jgi:hypothetical protein